LPKFKVEVQNINLLANICSRAFEFSFFSDSSSFIYYTGIFWLNLIHVKPKFHWIM